MSALKKPIDTDFDFGGIGTVGGLRDPVAPDEAATKQFVDQAVSEVEAEPGPQGIQGPPGPPGADGPPGSIPDTISGGFF